jgi:hypothetical protein
LTAQSSFRSKWISRSDPVGPRLSIIRISLRNGPDPQLGQPGTGQVARSLGQPTDGRNAPARTRVRQSDAPRDRCRRAFRDRLGDLTFNAAAQSTVMPGQGHRCKDHSIPRSGRSARGFGLDEHECGARLGADRHMRSARRRRCARSATTWPLEVKRGPVFSRTTSMRRDRRIRPGVHQKGCIPPPAVLFCDLRVGTCQMTVPCRGVPGRLHRLATESLGGAVFQMQQLARPWKGQ